MDEGEEGREEERSGKTRDEGVEGVEVGVGRQDTSTSLASTGTYTVGVMLTTLVA